MRYLEHSQRNRVTVNNKGIGFVGGLFLGLFFLKLMNLISISWWLVFLIPLGFIILWMLIVGLIIMWIAS